MRAAESRFSASDREGGAVVFAAAGADVAVAVGDAAVADDDALEDGWTSGWAGIGLGSGIGREARAGAKTARRARSAAEIRVSRGLSDCMDSL
jgi:hypothetical protein